MKPPLDLTGQFNITTYADALQNNMRLLSRFDAWGARREDKRDHETGAGPNGAVAWVHEHQPEQVPGGLYQTFIYSKKDDNRIVATGTVASDDRGVGANNKLDQDVFLGFHNVDYRYRNQGIGTAVFKHRNDHIQNWLDQHPERKSLHAVFFTLSPEMPKISAQFGWKSQGMVYVPDFKQEEELFTKDFFPSVEISDAPVNGVQTKPAARDLN